jgi:hypothetical protein
LAVAVAVTTALASGIGEGENPFTEMSIISVK